MATTQRVIRIDDDDFAWACQRLNDSDHAARDQHSDPEQVYWHGLVTALTNSREVKEVADTSPRRYEQVER